MTKRRYSGRKLIFWGALFLLVWAGLEIYARLDTIWWAMKGLWELCRNEHIPFRRALGYYDPSMFVLVIFLLYSFLFALLCVILRNRPKAGYLLLILDIGLAWFGFEYLGLLKSSAVGGMLPTGLASLVSRYSLYLKYLKALPLILIALGCVINLIQSFIGPRVENRRRRVREEDDYDDDYDDDEDEEYARRSRKSRDRDRRAESRRSSDHDEDSRYIRLT